MYVLYTCYMLAIPISFFFFCNFRDRGLTRFFRNMVLNFQENWRCPLNKRHG